MDHGGVRGGRDHAPWTATDLYRVCSNRGGHRGRLDGTVRSQRTHSPVFKSAESPSPQAKSWTRRAHVRHAEEAWPPRRNSGRGCRRSSSSDGRARFTAWISFDQLVCEHRVAVALRHAASRLADVDPSPSQERDDLRARRGTCESSSRLTAGRPRVLLYAARRLRRDRVAFEGVERRQRRRSWAILRRRWGGCGCAARGPVARAIAPTAMVVEDVVVLQHARAVLGGEHARLLLVVDPVLPERGRRAALDLDAAAAVARDVVPRVDAAAAVVDDDARGGRWPREAVASAVGDGGPPRPGSPTTRWLTDVVVLEPPSQAVLVDPDAEEIREDRRVLTIRS